MRDLCDEFTTFLLIDSTHIPKYWDTFCYLLNSPYDESTSFIVRLMKRNSTFCLQMIFLSKVFTPKKLKALGFIVSDLFYMMRQILRDNIKRDRSQSLLFKDPVLGEFPKDYKDLIKDVDFQRDQREAPLSQDSLLVRKEAQESLDKESRFKKQSSLLRDSKVEGSLDGRDYGINFKPFYPQAINEVRYHKVVVEDNSQEEEF